MVGGNATHIVMHSRQYRDRLLRHIHTGKNARSLTNARQTLRQQFRRQMIQMQINMILLGTHTASLANLHGHGTTYHIARGQILGTGGVPFHEPLALRVAQNAPLTTTSFRNQASRPINPGRMELHEFRILIRQSGTHGHGISISGTSMRTRTRKVGPSIPPRSQHGILGLNAMNRPIFHIQRRGTHALSIGSHEQIHGKVFDKVRGIKRQTPSVKSVKHGMSRTIGRTRASMGLSPLPEIERLSAKRALVNLALFGTRERQPEFFQFQNRLRGLPTHVVNGVLVAQPIAALDGIVHVPPPIVRAHVAEGGVDASLGGHGVRAGGEEFGHAGGFESGFAEAHGGAEAGAAGADDEGVVGVVDYGVVSREGGGGREGAGGGGGGGGMFRIAAIAEEGGGSSCESRQHFSSSNCLIQN
mmetsp:Transcript_30869/g.65337  ORF Transcript_30869/g.65337 Transcript_30869/m.65337 type:complete len:416 (-) Transcript_30869:68-1315(-)